VWISELTDFSAFELDELYWFLSERKSHKNGINTYLIPSVLRRTMVSRLPRQIVGFNVDKSVNKNAIQGIVDSVGSAEKYCTDGCLSYLDVIFGGKHIYNTEDKKDTHLIESTNADLRHHIRGLSRRSRCFFRNKETMTAVLSVFIDAYSKFGEWKLKYTFGAFGRKPVIHKSPNPSKHLHKWRYPACSVLDFLF